MDYAHFRSNSHNRLAIESIPDQHGVHFVGDRWLDPSRPDRIHAEHPAPKHSFPQLPRSLYSAIIRNWRKLDSWAGSRIPPPLSLRFGNEERRLFPKEAIDNLAVFGVHVIIVVPLVLL